MIIHARIYDPQATQIKQLADKGNRPVSNEVQQAVKTHIATAAKPRTRTRKRK